MRVEQHKSGSAGVAGPNKLEEVEGGGVPNESDVYTIFNDPLRDEWKMKWLPILKAMPMAEPMERSGLSRLQPENAANLKPIAREQGK